MKMKEEEEVIKREFEDLTLKEKLEMESLILRGVKEILHSKVFIWWGKPLTTADCYIGDVRLCFEVNYCQGLEVRCFLIDRYFTPHRDKIYIRGTGYFK
jgi:hypothetical protein